MLWSDPLKYDFNNFVDLERCLIIWSFTSGFKHIFPPSDLCESAPGTKYQNRIAWFATLLENKQDLRSFLDQEGKAGSLNTAWLGSSLLD